MLIFPKAGKLCCRYRRVQRKERMKKEKSAETLRLEARQNTLRPHMVQVGERVWQAVAREQWLRNCAIQAGNDSCLVRNGSKVKEKAG